MFFPVLLPFYKKAPNLQSSKLAVALAYSGVEPERQNGLEFAA